MIIFLVFFFGWNHCKNWTLTQTFSQMWQKNLNNIFFKNLKMYFKLWKYICLMSHLFQRPVIILWVVFGVKILLKVNKTLKLFQNMAILSKILSCVSKRKKTLMQYLFQRRDDPVMVFWMKKLEKFNIKLKICEKSPKHNLNNSFVGNLNIYSKGHYQIWRMPHSLKEFVVVFLALLMFLGAKIIKGEHSLKIFWKCLKCNLTNNSVGNFNKHFGYTQIQTMSCPFKGPMTIFGCFWDENIVKVEYDFKNNSKYDNDNWTNNFFKNFNMYLKQEK